MIISLFNSVSIAQKLCSYDRSKDKLNNKLQSTDKWANPQEEQKNRLVDRPIGRCFTYRWVDRSTDGSTDRLTDDSMNGSTNGSTDGSTDRTIDRKIGILTQICTLNFIFKVT